MSKREREVVEFGPHGLFALFNRRSELTAVVFIGGLTDGPLSVQYVDQLEEHFEVYRPLLRSSFGGFGRVTLEEDAEDIRSLLEVIGFKDVVLMGHSTGCQSILRFLERVPEHEGPVILQGAVSDRQYLTSIGLTLDERVIGDVMPSLLYGGYPITRLRFKGLMEERGDDDYFSTDHDWEWCVDRCARALGTERKALLLIGAEDEYLVGGMPRYDAFAAGLKAKCPHLQYLAVKGENHAMSQGLCSIANVLREFLPQ